MSVSVYGVLVLGVNSLFAALSVVAPVFADPRTGYGDRTPDRNDASFYLSFAKPLRDQALQTAKGGVGRSRRICARSSRIRALSSSPTARQIW